MFSLHHNGLNDQNIKRKLVTVWAKRINFELPLEMIHAYFGVQIASIFVVFHYFIRTLFFPTIFGLLVFIYGIFQ